MPQPIILLNLPLPPTENHLYPTFRGRRIKSKALVDYLRMMKEWRYANLNQSIFIKTECLKWIAAGSFISVKAVFVFERSKLFTKTNAVKELDASNRIKALHDGLVSEVLAIDDRYFWNVSAEKAVGLRNETHVLISPTQCRDFTCDGSSMEERLVVDPQSGVFRFES